MQKLSIIYCIKIIEIEASQIKESKEQISF